MALATEELAPSIVGVAVLSYRVAHKKGPQICNDVVWLKSKIQTKRNDSIKEQSQLNNMRNYDFIRFCFNSEIRKRVLGVRNVQNNQ